jgi:hypothetical protein
VVEDRALPMLVQLADFELDVIHGTLDVGLPCLERRSRLLQHSKPGLGGVVDVTEPLLPLGFEVAESALQFLILLVELLLAFFVE